jgi:hypothetical protein
MSNWDGFKVWLDDVRPMPSAFDIHVKTASEAIAMLAKGNVYSISLDHDLGDPSNGTGYDVAKYIEEQSFTGKMQPPRVSLHTSSPVGRKNMAQAIHNAYKYWEKKNNVV